MDVVQGHIRDHLTIMPSVLQIISTISVVIWLEHVQSWIFNSAIVDCTPTPTQQDCMWPMPWAQNTLITVSMAPGIRSKWQMKPEVTSGTDTKLEGSRSKGLMFIMQHSLLRDRADVFCLGKRGIN